MIKRVIYFWLGDLQETKEEDHKPAQMTTPKIEGSRRVFKRSFRYGIGIGTKIEAKRVRKDEEQQDKS